MAGIQTEKDAQIRSLLEKAGKLEVDLRATENLKQELHQARTDCQKLHAHSQELAQQVRNTNQELQRARSEVQQVPVLRAEMDTLRQELQRARYLVCCTFELSYLHAEVCYLSFVKDICWKSFCIIGTRE